MKTYDIAIVGGGIGGLMAAHRLITENPKLSIILFEKGHTIRKRSCPIISGKVKKCVRCASCDIMEGLAGAGAFSDGKYVISTEYGGWLTDFLSKDTVLRYIEAADDILVSFGAAVDRYIPNNDLKRLCLNHDLHMHQAQLKHLGTDKNFETMCNLVSFLEDKIELCCETTVKDVQINSHTILAQKDGVDFEVGAQQIILAVGRYGSNFLTQWCVKNNIGLSNTQVDIGVRVELPSILWEHFSKKIYEPKIWYRSKKYGDITRMFCFNERGYVVTENTDGVLSVNGHAFKDESRKSENSNFALLSTTRFTQPFNDPIKYARYVASLGNLISGGSVLVQRLGDLEEGRRTNEHRLAKSTTVPTLDAVAGDLSLCLPKRQLDNIVETLHALDAIAPGTANYDTLLYGIECKYYSARPETKDFEIDGAPNIYAVGDGAGFTRSLSHAAANGLYVADKILPKV